MPTVARTFLPSHRRKFNYGMFHIAQCMYGCRMGTTIRNFLLDCFFTLRASSFFLACLPRAAWIKLPPILENVKTEFLAHANVRLNIKRFSWAAYKKWYLQWNDDEKYVQVWSVFHTEEDEREKGLRAFLLHVILMNTWCTFRYQRSRRRFVQREPPIELTEVAAASGVSV